MTFGLIFKRRDGEPFTAPHGDRGLNLPAAHGWTWWGDLYDRSLSLAHAQMYIHNYKGNEFIYQIVRTS